MTVLAEILLGADQCDRAFIECSPGPKTGDMLRIRGRICKVLLVVRATIEAESRDLEDEHGNIYHYDSERDPFRIEIICVPIDVAALCPADIATNIVEFSVESEVAQ